MAKIDLTKQWLIREISSRTGFAIKDIRIVLDTLVSIVEDAVREKKTLIFSRLFRLSFREIKPYEMFNAKEGKKIKVEGAYRIILRASRSLLNVLKEK